MDEIRKGLIKSLVTGQELARFEVLKSISASLLQDLNEMVTKLPEVLVALEQALKVCQLHANSESFNKCNRRSTVVKISVMLPCVLPCSDGIYQILINSISNDQVCRI